MGTYQGIMFRAKLHPLGVEIVRQLYAANSWHRWQDVAKEYRAFAEYSMKPRCDFIPFSENMMDWDDIETGLVGGTWTVQASSYNRDHEHEMFMASVLPLLISEPVTVITRWDVDEGDDTETIVRPK